MRYNILLRIYHLNFRKSRQHHITAQVSSREICIAGSSSRPRSVLLPKLVKLYVYQHDDVILQQQEGNWIYKGLQHLYIDQCEPDMHGILVINRVQCVCPNLGSHFRHRPTQIQSYPPMWFQYPHTTKVSTPRLTMSNSLDQSVLTRS